MRQKEPKATPLEIQFERPGMRVAVSPHYPQRYFELFETDERPWIADIAQMPDLICSFQPLGKCRWVEIVGVRDDSNSHGEG